jgi:hypothetical protein
MENPEAKTCNVINVSADGKTPKKRAITNEKYDCGLTSRNRVFKFLVLNIEMRYEVFCPKSP